MAELEKYKEEGISWSSLGPAEVGFQERLMSALMLQQNLVFARARVEPSPEAAVQARYEQALSELLAGLRSRAAIQITTL